MPSMITNVAPEDDFRSAYEGTYNESRVIDNAKWLERMAGGAPDGAGQAPEALVENPMPADPVASPEPSVADDEEDGGLLDYARSALSGVGSVVGDVGRGLTEAVPQAFGGLVDAIGQMDRFMQSVAPIGGLSIYDEEGNFSPSLVSSETMKADYDAGETLFKMIAPEDADSVTGGLIRSTSQFLTGFLPGMQLSRMVGLGTFGSAMMGGAIADAVVFDPHEARLSSYLNEVPYLKEIVPDYLADHGAETETEWEGRLKNAIEGAGLGLVADGLMTAFRYYKAQRKITPEPEALGAKAQAARDIEAAKAQAEIGTDITDDMLRPLGDAAEDAPLVIEARPDETLAMSLGRLAEADQRAAAMVEQGGALEKITSLIDKRKARSGDVPAVPTGETRREPIDDALDELRSGAVSRARFPARPVAAIVRQLGGVDPTSSLAGDLRSRGITSKSFPGLFRKGGLKALDNVPGSEHGLFIENGRVSPDGYIDQQSFIDGLETELKGNPWRTGEEARMIDEIVAPANELDEQLSRLGIEYENMSNDAVKARLQEIVDEQEAWRVYQEGVEARVTSDGSPRTYAQLADEQREIWTVEQTADARAAGLDEATIQSHQPNKVYINMARIKGAEDVKQLIQTIADADAAHIKDKARGVVSNAQTIKESSAEWKDLNDLIGRAPGPMNASQAFAARKVLASSAEQVAQLAKLAGSPNAGKVDLYNFRRALSVHAAIQAEVISARTETARALQSWAIPAGSDKMRTDAINNLIATQSGGDLQKLAQAVGNLNNEAAINQIARESVTLKTADALYSVYVNGLLSGPKTHMVNAMSNAAVALYAIPERYLSSAFSRAFGNGDIAKGEASAMAYGMIEGMRDGFRLMVNGAKAEGVDGIGELWEQFGKTEVRPNPISGAAFNANADGSLYRGLDLMGSFISLPGAALERADLFFKSLNYRMELHALAFREASLEGLEGDAFASRMSEILMNPPATLRDKANEMALVNTFTNPLGETGRKWQQSISGSPIRWAVPFVRTPTNIMKYSFSRTPLAYASSAIRADIAAGGARAAQAHARVGLGTMSMLTFAGLAMDGVITGGGPINEDLQSAMRAEGWQPYSMKIGDKWVSYSRLDPLGMMIGMAADLAEIANSPDTGEDDRGMIFVAALTGFTQNMASKTYAQGIFELAAALDPRNPTSDPGKFLARQAQGIMPYSALIRQTAQGLDPVMRESRDEAVTSDGDRDQMLTYFNKLVNDFKRNIPGLSDTLPPMRDIFGDPITRMSGLGAPYDMISPIQVSPDRTDHVTRAIIENEVKVSRPSRTINGVYLDARQYDELQQIAGPMVWDMLDKVVSAPGFNRLPGGPDGLRAQMIKNIVTQAHTIARDRLSATDPELRETTMNKRIKQNNLLLGN